MNFKTAGSAAMRIKRLLLDVGYEPQLARRAAIIAYELEMNLIIHGGGGQLAVKLSPDFIEIYAGDQGPGIPDVELAMQEGYSTAPPQVREMGLGAGMGLPNVKHWADVLKIDTKVDEGTRLRAIVYCTQSK
ncbi:MAG: anti-sigma regulatory factor [Clostridia bacterium]|nr:anti-sigma regulatory factor [Clostridia bacterium]